MSCPLYGHPFLYLVCRAKKHCTDIVLLKIHHYSPDTVFELKKFSGLGIDKAENPDNAVADLKHLADLFELQFCPDVLELPQQYIRYFAWFYILCHKLYYSSVLFNELAAYRLQLGGDTCVYTAAFHIKDKASYYRRVHLCLQFKSPACLVMHDIRQFTFQRL